MSYDRRKTAVNDIDALLEPGQKEAFNELVRMTRFDRDLFECTEGLLLDDDQAFSVEGILIDYYNQVKVFMPGGMDRGRGEPGEGPPEGKPGMERGGDMMPMGMPGSGRMRHVIKRYESKKNWAIKKILTKEQKKLFKQLTKHRKKEMKERREKMKERRKNMMNRN
jgi:hypothetical protein